MEEHLSDSCINWDNVNVLVFSECNNIDLYFSNARKFVENNYLDQLNYFRGLRPEHITENKFIDEYVWVVYASGFNASVLSKKWDKLKSIYSQIYIDLGFTSLFSYDIEKSLKEACELINRRDKAGSIVRVLTELDSIGYAAFRNKYLSNLDSMMDLPFIGPTTKYHLGRNLGIDCVKPDVHLVRMAEYFGFSTPLAMCEYLGTNYNERIGVVDLILWYAASTFGTQHMRSMQLK